MTKEGEGEGRNERERGEDLIVVGVRGEEEGLGGSSTRRGEVFFM